MDILQQATASYSAEVKDTIGLLSMACRSMKAILDDTLDFAKMEKGMFRITTKPASLLEVIVNTVNIMSPFSKEIDSGMVMVVNVEVRYTDPDTNAAMKELLAVSGYYWVSSWFRQWWGHNELWKLDVTA